MSSVKSFFQQFVGNSPKIIGLMEIENFLSTCGINPISLECLVFAFVCQSETMGELTLEEFKRGCKKLRIKNNFSKELLLQKVKEKTIRYTIEKRKFWPLFYFAFQYLLDKTAVYQRTVDSESLLAMLAILYPDKPPQTQTISKFILQNNYKSLNKDQWMSIAYFIDQYLDDPNLSTYDEADAWPVFLDEYVEWYRKFP